MIFKGVIRLVKHFETIKGFAYMYVGATVHSYCDEYEECGGPLDGQEFPDFEDLETKEEIHVKKEDVLEIIE